MPHSNIVNPPSHDVFHRIYETLERMVLFIAFDFTILNLKDFFNGPPKAADYSKLRKKCIHKPTVPPRTSPRKHIRAKIKTYEEPKEAARKKSNVESAPKKKKVETPKVIKYDETFDNAVNDEKTSDLKIVGGTVDGSIDGPIDENHVPSSPPTLEIDVLTEAMNESPEKLMETLIAFDTATKVYEEQNAMASDFSSQQFLAGVGAQLIADPNHGVEYSTQTQEKLGDNFCINRTTTFHLDPSPTFPYKI